MTFQERNAWQGCKNNGKGVKGSSFTYLTSSSLPAIGVDIFRFKKPMTGDDYTVNHAHIIGCLLNQLFAFMSRICTSLNFHEFPVWRCCFLFFCNVKSPCSGDMVFWTAFSTVFFSKSKEIRISSLSKREMTHVGWRPQRPLFALDANGSGRQKPRKIGTTSSPFWKRWVVFFLCKAVCMFWIHVMSHECTLSDHVGWCCLRTENQLVLGVFESYIYPPA